MWKYRKFGFIIPNLKRFLLSGNCGCSIGERGKKDESLKPPHFSKQEMPVNAASKQIRLNRVHSYGHCSSTQD
jgi:hypothetical protein